MDPAGIFLSNGPGDPAAVERRRSQRDLRTCVGKKPIFGICLGHQILSIVLGAKTHKMPFGHHGANHPVRDLLTKPRRDHLPEPLLRRRARLPAGRTSS